MVRGWQPWLFATLIAATLAFFVEIHQNLSPEMPVQRQFQRLNPDARLYYGLAGNLVDGTGFRDTVRNREILPPIGHPLWLAATFYRAGWSPALQARLASWLAIGLLAAGVAVYCRSLFSALIAVLVYGAYLRGIVWLAGGVETTIVLAQGLLVLCLAVFYRSGFAAPAGVASGAALAAGLLVRPMYVYLLHAATALASLLLLRELLRTRRAPPAGALRGVLALVLTAQLVVAAVNVTSHVRYGDSRLVSGTYSSWALYLANSPYLEPALVYHSQSPQPPAFDEVRKEFREWTWDWQGRRAHFMGLVFDYWRSQPGRALRGYLWRLQHFLGLHLAQVPERFAPLDQTRPEKKLWGPGVHPLAVVALLLLSGARLVQLWRRRGDPTELRHSFGLLLALLFATYAATHSLFAFIGFRYVTGSTPMIAAALAVLAHEVRRPAPAAEQ